MEKGLHTGALYRDVDRKFLAPIPLSMRDARKLSNPKDFRSVAPLSASNRYVEFQFGSSRLATPSSRSSISPFLPFFLFAREIFLESKPLLFWQHPNFRPPSMKRRTKKFLARERRERFATWHFTPSSRRLLFRRSFSFLFFFFETTEI